MRTSLSTVTDEILRHICTAADAAAGTFDRRGSSVKERELEMAFESALRGLGLEPQRQAPLRLADAWSGRVGGVDLALGSSEDSRSLIELKWDPATLAACAWDSVKLACALQAEEGKRAFLVAGSPRREPAIQGDWLLDEARIEPQTLRGEYASEFDFWKEDVKNHPRYAPEAWRIHAMHCSDFEWKAEPWRIRVAEVGVEDERLVEFK
jgi:hypothetical protein